MKWSLLAIVFSHYWKIIDAEESNFIYTYAMAAHCKECIRQSYNYDTFYSINAFDAKNFRSSRNVVFEMHFAIQAASNGHILLSPIAFPNHNTSVYEIVVGGGGNIFTELRRNLKRNARASATTPNILSAVELRGFYIKISNSGLVEFGREGATLPILSFMDIDPLDIRYFSFAAWTGVEAKFLYDCPAIDDMANQTLPDSKPIERNLSNSDRLKKELLQDRPPHLAPGPNVDVSLKVVLSDVSFNSFESKLTTKMYLLTSWRDESLSWYPAKYGNVTSLKFRQGQVWRPMFHIFNSDSLNALKTTGHELIEVFSSGKALFHFKAVFDTWCSSETEMNRWPRDEYYCMIVIEPWEPHEKITLTDMDISDQIFKQFLDTEEVARNEWQIINASHSKLSPDLWNSLSHSKNNLTHQSDRLFVEITIQREATSYKIVFYTPLLVLMVFVLVSFWGEPLKMSRIWFYAVSTNIICMGLCYIDYLIPCHQVPCVLIIYFTVLGGVLLALIIHVLLMTKLAEKLCKTSIMQTVLSTKWFRTLFCLPAIKKCKYYNTINEGFSPQEEEDDSSVIITPRNGIIEEMQEDNIKYCEKEELAEALDKMLFIVYSLVFAVMLGLYS